MIALQAEVVGINKNNNRIVLRVVNAVPNSDTPNHTMTIEILPEKIDNYKIGKWLILEIN